MANKQSAIHMLLNHSRSKGNQAIKFRQFIEYNGKIKKKNAENESGRLVPDFFLYFRKALHEVKASDVQLSFNVFR